MRSTPTVLVPALLALVLLAAPLGAAQTVRQPVRAITQDGRTVLLHPDGTWTERLAGGADVLEGEAIELDLSDGPPPPPAPPPPAAPPRTLESPSGIYTLRYDASRWRPSGQRLNVDSEFEYALPSGAGYAITIYEVTPFDLKTMADLVLAVARQDGQAEVTLVNREPAELGATDGVRLEYRVQMANGVDVTFLNTIYSDDRGTLQVVTWTTTAVLARFRDELVRFQDGLSIAKPSP